MWPRSPAPASGKPRGREEEEEKEEGGGGGGGEGGRRAGLRSRDSSPASSLAACGSSALRSPQQRPRGRRQRGRRDPGHACGAARSPRPAALSAGGRASGGAAPWPPCSGSAPGQGMPARLRAQCFTGASGRRGWGRPRPPPRDPCSTRRRTVSAGGAPRGARQLLGLDVGSEQVKELGWRSLRRLSPGLGRAGTPLSGQQGRARQHLTLQVSREVQRCCVSGSCCCCCGQPARSAPRRDRAPRLRLQPRARRGLLPPAACCAGDEVSGRQKCRGGE